MTFGFPGVYFQPFCCHVGKIPRLLALRIDRTMRQKAPNDSQLIWLDCDLPQKALLLPFMSRLRDMNTQCVLHMATI